MYLSQQINVKLTQENADILKQPSKVFNKIKSVFNGKMTPAEAKQANVMLSVLQRLNVAHRKAGFEDLVSIAANDKLIYECSLNAVNNLESGNAALTDNFNSGDITKINTLALTIDSIRKSLRFLIHINIVRKPKAPATPIIIKIYAFINEFKKLPTESEQELAMRVKSLIRSEWGNKQQQSKKLGSLEQEFNFEVSKLQNEINRLFPAQSQMTSKRKVLGKTTPQSRYHSHRDRYDDVYDYLPYFYMEVDKSEHFDSNEYLRDKLEVWDEDNSYHDEGSSSWFSGSGDSSGDSSSSSCGSSCGGGCGS